MEKLRERTSKTQFVIALCAVVAVGLFLRMAWQGGFREGLAEAAETRQSEIERRMAAATPQALEMLDLAMDALWRSDLKEAEKLLAGLRLDSPDMPALDYVAALAAIQAGDYERAEELLNSSLEKGEKVADALALSAVAEVGRASGSGYPRLINPSHAALDLLEQAKKQDPSSPAPRIEAANYLRSLGHNQEALAELRAARSRMHPVDLLVGVESTVALLEVEIHGTEGAHVRLPMAGNWPSLFQAALIALIQGEDEAAINYLEQCREGLPSTTFKYLVFDPAIRKFSYRPTLADYFSRLGL